MNFEFCLFSVDPFFISEAVKAGIQTIIVDWEYKNKHERQRGYDTQINNHCPADLTKAREATTATIICRINPIDNDSEKEIQTAINLGADEILIPMVQTVDQVKWTLDYVKDKAKVGILIETNAAVKYASELTKLPLSRIYVGLNDLSIDHDYPSIFTPLQNGLLSTLRSQITCSFGFGGITLPDKGHPIPAHLLIAEIIRLRCDFTFLRRSFISDTQGKNLSSAIETIKKSFQNAKERSPLEVYLDHKELVNKIYSLNSYATTSFQ